MPLLLQPFPTPCAQFRLLFATFFFMQDIMSVLQLSSETIMVVVVVVVVGVSV